MKPEIINLLKWEDIRDVIGATGIFLFDYDKEFYQGVLENLRRSSMSESKKRYLYLIEKAEQATGAKATRSKNYWSVLTRSFVSYRMWKEGMTFMDIGRICDRDHATIINQVRKVEDIIGMPKAFKDEYDLYVKFENMLEDGEEEQ